MCRGSNIEDSTVDNPDSICAELSDVYPPRYVACQGTTCKPVSQPTLCIFIVWLTISRRLLSIVLMQIDCGGMAYQRVRRETGDDGEQQAMNRTCTSLQWCPEVSYSRTKNFNAMFAIIAFVTIALLAAIFGTSWAMWTMDPGEDSIVYQMTAPRVKTE